MKNCKQYKKIQTYKHELEDENDLLLFDNNIFNKISPDAKSIKNTKIHEQKINKINKKDGSKKNNKQDNNISQRDTHTNKETQIIYHKIFLYKKNELQIDNKKNNQCEKIIQNK